MWFWWKVKRFFVGFQILQVSLNSKLSISSMIFWIDFFFRVGSHLLLSLVSSHLLLIFSDRFLKSWFFPFASNFELKWKLKSPLIIMLLLPILFMFCNILWDSVSVRSCCDSVLHLKSFIKTNLTSAMGSISKTQSFSSAVWLTRMKDFDPTYPIPTLHELVFFRGKKN